MKSFATSLLIGSTAAVRIQEGNFLSSWEGADDLISNLADKIEEQVTQGAISVVDKDNIADIDSKVLDIASVVPVKSPAEQIESVIEQVKEGFELIQDINAEAEKKQIKKAQRKQKKAIDEVMEDANDEAAEIIEEESDAEEAAEEVEEVMDEAADEIEEINADHDENVATIAKTTFVAEITNDTVKDKILREIVGAAEIGEDVNEVIAEQHLPFNVQAPLIVADDETADAKLDRIVCRSGDCVGDIKQDPEFDSFLGQVLDNFEAFKAAPEFADADFYYDESEYLPETPERPEPIGAPERPDPIDRPKQPEPVQGTRGIEAKREPRFKNPGADLDVDRSFDRSGFRPGFSYKPEYTGHGIDLSGLRLEDQAYGRNLYGGFQVPELDISQSERERPEKEPKEW